jgi:hypothetical protein
MKLDVHDYLKFQREIGKLGRMIWKNQKKDEVEKSGNKNERNKSTTKQYLLGKFCHAKCSLHRRY